VNIYLFFGVSDGGEEKGDKEGEGELY